MFDSMAPTPSGGGSDAVQHSALKQVLSDLLKKLRSFGIDEDEDQPDDADPMGAESADSTEGTDLDELSKNPDGDAGGVADPSANDEEEAPGGPTTPGLKDDIKNFFQKSGVDQSQGEPKKGLRMNVTTIKAGPLKKGMK